MVEVDIKPDKYGPAIALLLQRGEGFQTRFERKLIVNAQQRQVLEKAGFLAVNGGARTSRKGRGEKAK
jgi:hypothetical protein